jgi:hypothetical protein
VLIGRERQPVRAGHIVDQNTHAAVGLDLVDAQERKLLNRLRVIRVSQGYVAAQPVVGIREVDPPRAMRDDVVRAVELLAFKAVHDSLGGTAVRRAAHSATAVLAGQQPSIAIEGEAVGVAAGLAVDLGSVRSGPPAVDAVVRDITEEQAAVLRYPDRPLSEPEAGAEPLFLR